MSTQELTAQLLAEKQAKQALLAERQQLLEQVANLKSELSELKRMLFGSKRERFVASQSNDQQLTLALDENVPAEDPAKVKQTISYQRAVKGAQPSRHSGRQPLPANLPRKEIVLEPDEDTSQMRKVGEEVTEQLEMIPAKLIVLRYIRPRYVSQSETFHIAALPARPIEKGIPGPGLIAQILMDKFCHHLPFHRQQVRLMQMGMKIPISTLSYWLTPACDVLEPVFEALKFEALQTNYLQVDETPIQVLDKNKKGKTHRGYHWVYYAPEQRLVLFDYQKGRSREGPSGILKNYEGYLQTDGYQVYEELLKKEGLNIVLVGCMAHARRYFEKALDNDPSRAGYAMLLFQQLYAVEQEARDRKLTSEQRQQLREEKSQPIMERLGQWIVEEYPKVLPKSTIGKALHYLAERYNKLQVYINEGKLEIDNNLVENKIRPVAIGRKNYLFAGSHDAAQRAAMIYSLLGSCKLNNINPNDYLKDVLQRLPEHPINKIKELLPNNWKPQN